MLTNDQLLKILLEVEKHPNGGSVSALDREIRANLDCVIPYVNGYHYYMRSFTHKGLSEEGVAFLAEYRSEA